MYKNFSRDAEIHSGIANSVGGGNDPDNGCDLSRRKNPNELPYVVGNVDSKTKEYERYTDCLAKELSLCNSIKKDILNKKVFRI